MCTSLEKPSADLGNKNKAIEFMCEEMRSVRSDMDAIAIALEKGNLRNYTEEQLYMKFTKVNNHPLSLSLIMAYFWTDLLAIVWQRTCL